MSEWCAYMASSHVLFESEIVISDVADICLAPSDTCMNRVPILPNGYLTCMLATGHLCAHVDSTSGAEWRTQLTERRHVIVYRDQVHPTWRRINLDARYGDLPPNWREVYLGVQAPGRRVRFSEIRHSILHSMDEASRNVLRRGATA